VVGRTDESREATGLAERGRAARAEGDFGGAVSSLLDAARTYGALGDKKSARECADEVLALWPAFEESKTLFLEPARPKKPSIAAGRRRGRPKPAPAQREPSPAAPSKALPSMFVEMHAEALLLAGREREARARFAEALAGVEAEVARRRASQEWSEAFSAGLTLLRLADRVGDAKRLERARREFVALARESARESLTAEYFARGKDDLPLAAIEAAAREARGLGDGALGDSIKGDEREVLERSAELLEMLSDERGAAQAVLSWEDAWSFLDARPQMRRALLERPELARSLTGPLASLEGLAETHPARLEVREFADRVDAVVARASGRAPALRQRLASSRPP
jgi:hypothetical protein